MFKIRVSGDYRKVSTYLEAAKNFRADNLLYKYGEAGVRALSEATPQRTGKTSKSWIYKISRNRSGYSIEWMNTNRNKGVSVAILIRYGHGTGTGGYVRGLDYISPAMGEIFKEFARDLEAEVRRL